MTDLETLRHSTAHLLAAAVLDLWPKAKPTIGPPIETGFYYDFNDLKISEEDLPKIEEKMRELLKTWDKFEKREHDSGQVKMTFKDNPYKLELIEELVTSHKSLVTYSCDNFVDLCAGPHVDDVKKLGHFKLLKIAGAYWRGDEKSKMLTRIYGTAFFSQKELDEYLKNLAEAEKRDHRKLGREFDLFCFSDLVGPGLVMWTPKGTIIKKELYKYIVEINKKYGAQEVAIPHMAKIDLYETSVHWF